MVCTAGEYKDTVDNAACTACTGNSTSAEGRDAITECKCMAGFSGNADETGGECTECTGGKYKDEVGNSACTWCTGNWTSAEGSDAIADCKCIAGLSGNASAAGGKCTPSYPEFVPQCCAAVDQLRREVERLKQQGDQLGSEVVGLKQQGEQCGSEVERLNQQGEQLGSEFERLKQLVTTRSSFIPTGNRTMTAWGNSGYSRCQLPFSWTELNKGYKECDIIFRTGGLGRHMQENVYESWVCMDHFCGDPVF